VVADADTNAATFQLETLSAIYGEAPASPLTVQQVMPVGYRAGEAAEAQYNETTAQWENTFEANRLITSATDTKPRHLKDKLRDPGTFNSSNHQLVFAEEVNNGGLLQMRLFTAKVSAQTAGCGIQIIEDEISVVPADLAGDGLIADDVTCQLHVRTGCGITLGGPENNRVTLDYDQIIGCGLAVDPTGTCPTLFVDANDLAGKGLQPSGETDCQLDVLIDECSLRFGASDELEVFLTPSSGCIDCDATTGLKVKLAANGGLACTANGLALNISCELAIENGELKLRIKSGATVLTQCSVSGVVCGEPG
jgi:hypothetical protein